MQDYIDAKSGGAGLGWYRIVRDPEEASRTIAAGKLAVVLGSEVDHLFNCDLDRRCSQEIIRKGEALLGNRFKPLTDFISLQQYRCLLGEIDLAIFNHQRQQGLGNIIALLAKGKTVYLRPEVTTRACFEQMGITLMDTFSIQLHRLAATTAASNIRIMREHFSVSAYKRMLHEVFYS